MSTEQRRLLAVVLVPVFMALLAVSSINVVLPAIQSSIAATDTQIQWILSGYTLTFGVVLVAAGRAGDAHGRGRLFVVGLALFGLGSLASGGATDGALLDLARLVMGVGSGLLNPQTVGFIQQYFSGVLRARAFASFGAAVGLSVAIGPLMGGAFVQVFGAEWGWRATFLVNVPIALGAIVLARRWFPPSAFERDRRKGRADLDPVGMLLFGLAVLLVMLPFLERGFGPVVFVLTPLGLALLGLWVWWERRYQRRGHQPMVNLELFRIRSYANGVMLIGLQFTGITSVYAIVAMYLQNGQGATALHAALIGLPSAFATAICSTIAGRVVLRMGRRLVAIGIVTALVAILGSIGVVAAHTAWGTSVWWLAVPLTFLGAGQGMVVSPNQTLSLLEVPAANSGSAGGVMQTGQRIGTAIGIAFITATFFVVQASHGWDLAFVAAFAWIVLTILLALTVALLDIRAARRQA